VLLDVRPAPQHPWVAVGCGSTGCKAGEGSIPPYPDPTLSHTRRTQRAIRLGQLDDSYRIGTQAIADAALQALIDGRRLVREREETFTLVYHFDSVESWLAYMAEQWSTARLSADLTARARRQLSGEEGQAGARRGANELRILRSLRASRLRRV